MKRVIALILSIFFALSCFSVVVFAEETTDVTTVSETAGGDSKDLAELLSGAKNMFVTRSSHLFRASLDTLNIQGAVSGAGTSTTDTVTSWVECDITQVTRDSDVFTLTIKDNTSVTLFSDISLTKGAVAVSANNAAYFAYFGSDKKLRYGIITAEGSKAVYVYSDELENISLLDDFKDKVSVDSTFTEEFTDSFDLQKYSKPFSKSIYDNVIGGNAKYAGETMKDVQVKIYSYDAGAVSTFVKDAKEGTITSTNELQYNAQVGSIDGFAALDTDYTMFTGWMSADTSSITGNVSKQCYIIIEIKFKTDNEVKAGKKDSDDNYTYCCYGTLWIAPAASGDDKCMLLYVSPDLSSIGSAREKAGTAGNTMSNMADGANMVNWDTYDVKNDVDIGDRLGSIVFDERELDDTTMSRLLEIKRELQHRKAQSTKDWFDIVMKIGGIIVLVYTIVLGVAYAFDTSNTLVDIELVRLVTFNRVVCVRDNDDLKYMQEKGSSQFLLTKKYFVIYMVVGILLSVFMLNTDLIRVVAEAVFTALSH